MDLTRRDLGLQMAPNYRVWPDPVESATIWSDFDEEVTRGFHADDWARL